MLTSSFNADPNSRAKRTSVLFSASVRLVKPVNIHEVSQGRESHLRRLSHDLNRLRRYTSVYQTLGATSTKIVGRCILSPLAGLLIFVLNDHLRFLTDLANDPSDMLLAHSLV